MGMKEVFGNASFDNLFEVQNEQLRVSQVIHKAFIEVNEYGAEGKI
jgi:serine protease inhibitor